MRDERPSGNHHIELAGEYDIARRQEVAVRFSSITNGAPVTIDMSQVTYVDSTFLNELAAMRLRLHERPVTLVGVQPNIARILRIAKLDRFFLFQAGQGGPKRVEAD
jgi:anti-anti-sigma factor